MDPLVRLDLALDHARSVVARMPPDAWNRVTNCEPWTASMMLNHMHASQKLWVQTLTGDRLVEIDDVTSPQPLAGDPLAETDAAIALAKATWAGDDVLTTEYTGAFGTLTGEATIVFPTIDAIGHAWDLALAAGLDPDMDDDLVAAGEEVVALGINDTTRGFGLFAAAADPGPDASATDALMAKTGRLDMSV